MSAYARVCIGIQLYIFNINIVHLTVQCNHHTSINLLNMYTLIQLRVVQTTFVLVISKYDHIASYISTNHNPYQSGTVLRLVTNPCYYKW